MKKGQTESNNTIIRSVIIVPFIILIIWFIAQMKGTFMANPIQSFDDLISTAAKAKDNEPFTRQISLQDFYLYGFNYSKEIKADGKTILKPEECGEKGCMCMCKDNECKSKENMYCKSIEGINDFVAYGFLSVNKGSIYRNGKTVALEKNKVVCFDATREKNTLHLFECGIKLENA